MLKALEHLLVEVRVLNYFALFFKHKKLSIEFKNSILQLQTFLVAIVNAWEFTLF